MIYMIFESFVWGNQGFVFVFYYVFSHT